MKSSTCLGAAIASDDLAVLAEVAMMRLPTRTAEAHRLERMRTVLDAEAELARTLAAHAHCGLVNFRGSPGAFDLAAETDSLALALERYARLVKEIACEYRRVVAVPNVPLELLPGSERAQLVAG